MIHLSTIPVEDKTAKSPDWKELLSQSRLTTHTLLKLVGLENHPLASGSAESLFELRAPKPYIEKIEYGNPNDPLLLQILPQQAENKIVEGFSSDPLDESEYSPVKGLIHKYKNRVLLIASSTCVINCRYCFRRSFSYSEHRQSKSDWQGALDYIRNNQHISEVILSGGDPLIHNNDYLFWLLKEIDQISHVSRIRIHSRLIVSLPQRIDADFLASLDQLSKSIIIVMHSNHANELGDELAVVAQELRKKRVTLLNQSVLLRAVNDQAEILTELSQALFEIGVLPYYLFILDKVAGAAHFDVPISEATAIHKTLLAALPGYLVPKLVIEIPGENSKTSVSDHFDKAFNL
jgi:EF-P beta-lysylation protein EpmB